MTALRSVRSFTASRQGLTVALSLAVHALVASGVLVLAVHGMEKSDARDLELARVAAAEAARMNEGLVQVESWPEQSGVVPRPAGGATVPRIDTGERGQGGETAEEAARHLADRNDRIRFTPEASTFHDRDQVQRIESARKRSSWEDRRSTTRPMELSFVVTGDGRELERRPKATFDPARGALSAAAPQHEGRTYDGETLPGEGASVLEPGAKPSPGAGVRDGREVGPHRAAARPGFARPDIPEAVVSVNAAESAKVRDNVDSRQAVASAVEAIVHASYAGGAQGDGQGGSQGGGAPGAGGTSGDGSHPRPLGAGTGDWIDFDTTDPALASYFRRLKAKMHPALARAFPRQAALDLRQGFVIVEFTIQKDGAIDPRLVRPSGIDEYDRNCITALRGISPEPLPKSVARSSLKVRGRFEAANPIIK